jgi:Cu/Ag efflux protein CusF
LKLSVLGVSILALSGCAQTKTTPADKQYTLTGKVISVDAKAHTATIDGAAIPNFMDAMKMEYPIASDTDLAALKPGESISATVKVADDGSYSLASIHENASRK